MRFLRRLATLLAYLSFAGLATAQDLPLQMDEAFHPSLSRLSPNEIEVNWQIEPGYYLYREYLAAKSGDGSPITLETPPGKLKEDPGFGSTEVYYDTAVAKLVGEAATIELTYQGCQDGGLCYPPVTKTIDTSLLQISGTDPFSSNSGSSSGDTNSSSQWTTPSGVSAGFSLTQEATTTGVDTLLSRGGLPLLLLGFVGFGMLLAFTPCVFPMYPIVAAMLSREGEALSPKRGLVLSSIYVGALALAFGLFGVVAAWSGQNLQFALQSSAATIVIAVLFLVLALSNFGLFEIQLPAALNKRLSGSRRGSSLGGAATLGFTSAFLIGPCVTAPLAGALLYIARTGDVVVGAAALFALGIGKGIPLIVMATIGGKALPRAGVWMASIRSAFGFGFIATAVWMISPLLPEGIVLLAWACLAVAFGIFLAQLLNEGTPAGTRIVARSAALLSIAWGALLLVGVGLGANDPLAPLEPLRASSGVDGATTFEVTKSDFRHVASADELRSNLAEAEAEDKPSLVYVTADWCVTCRGIERSVLPADSVSAALGGVRLLAIDMTSTTPAMQQLLSSLHAVGPPTMIFFDRDTQEAAGTRLVGEVTVDNLAASALIAKSPQP